MLIFRLLYSRQYFPYIFFALFLAVVPLYFVYTIFIAVLPLCFLCYSNGSAALIFRMLYAWLYEVITRLSLFLRNILSFYIGITNELVQLEIYDKYIRMKLGISKSKKRTQN